MLLRCFIINSPGQDPCIRGLGIAADEAADCGAGGRRDASESACNADPDEGDLTDELPLRLEEGIKVTADAAKHVSCPSPCLVDAKTRRVHQAVSLRRLTITCCILKSKQIAVACLRVITTTACIRSFW